MLGSESYMIESDSSISYRLTDDGYYFFDSVSCSLGQVPDEAEHYTYNTSQGFTELLYDAFYPSYRILVGSKINNVVKGNINLPLTVREINSQNILNLYTDPANDKLFIKSFVPLGDISIIDMMGKVLYKEHFNSNQNNIDISFLHSAVYFVVASSFGGRITCKKFLKND